MAQEYWLISAPSDPTCDATYRKLAEVTVTGDLTTNYKFNIPDLKVRLHDCLDECIINHLGYLDHSGVLIGYL